MKKLTAEQSMMAQKLLSLFKNKGDVKTVKEIHQELIGRINFSISSTYFCFIDPLVSRGYLKVDNINNPSLIEIYGKVDENSGSNAMELKNSIRIKEDVNGMEYEFYESILAIKSKISEPVSMPHSETIKVLKLIDKVKSSSFIVHN